MYRPVDPLSRLRSSADPPQLPLATARPDVDKRVIPQSSHLLGDLHPVFDMALRFLLASAVLAVTAAQQNVGDPIKDFCRRHLHQTCIIDSKLYIDGGKVYYGGYVDNSSVAEQSELWQRRAGTMLMRADTRLLWENVLDTKNDFKFPPQYSNLTKVC